MRTDKERGALRVMEALSAVDEELLERCGEPGAAPAEGNRASGTPEKGRLYLFVRRYGKVCAACLCLLALGAACLNLRQIRMGNSEGGRNMANGAMQSAERAEEGGEPLEAADLADGAPDVMENEMSGGADGGPDEYSLGQVSPEWLDVGSLAAVPEESREDNRVTQDGISQEGNGMSQVPAKEFSAPEVKENLKNEAFFTGARVPEEYDPVKDDPAEAEAGAEGQAKEDSLICEWSDGEHSLWLRFTQTGLTADMRFETEPPVYTVQENWRELIPAAGADGYVQFALLYENGMLAEYRGVLTREEIIELMESIER